MTARAELLGHLAAENDDLPKSYCDKHGGYVDEGRTRPYANGSPYRICDACIDEARRRLAKSEDYCTECSYLGSFHINGRCPVELGPNGARALGGDR